MPLNELHPFYEDASRFSAQALAAVTGKRFVAISGNRVSGPAISDNIDGGNYQVSHAGAGAASVGVSCWDAAIGEKVAVIVRGIVPVTCSAGTLAFGSLISSDAVGKARITVTATDKVLGILMTVSGAIDTDGEVMLTLGNVAQGT